VSEKDIHMLTQTEIASALAQSKDGKRIKKKAGSGLYLNAIGGAANWTFQYWDRLASGKMGTRTKGLGSLTALPTYKAAEAARIQFVAGGKVSAPVTVTVPAGPTFREAAQSWLRSFETEVCRKHYELAEGRLLGRKGSHGKPSILEPLHDLPVASITPEQVADVLRPHWKGKGDHVTDQTRSLAERVFRDAVVTPNPADWRILQASKFGLSRARVEREHHAAMPLTDLQTWYRSLDATDPEHRAIMFYVLTGGGSRRNPLMLATWKDIDLEARTWTVPAELTKMKRPAVFPLSDAALAVLGPKGEPDARVFGPFTNERDALNLRLLCGFKPEYADLHGLRGSFRSWAQAKANGVSHATAEAILMHAATGDKGERLGKVALAYMHHDFAEEKREALDKWAAFCTGSERPVPVITLHGGEHSVQLVSPSERDRMKRDGELL
jgi:integrase